MTTVTTVTTQSEGDKWIIRTSDRLTFKECRLRWDWGSKIRQNYEPNRTDENLSFGTAVHAGMAELYDPRGWGAPVSVRLALAKTAFAAALPPLPQQPSDVDRLAHAEALELGRGMLAHYVEWAVEWDKGITPTHVEIEFEVPIPAPSDSLQLHGLYYQDLPVVYQGRIDLIVQDAYGEYWIVDWKTAGQIQGDHEWLQMDEQISSYCFSMQQMLGIRIAGFLYVELLKDLPKPPKVLKNGTLSVDKRQNTTEKLYLAKLAEMGYTDLSPYEEMLDYLRAAGNKFFRRTQVHRSPRELELMGERIGQEAVDMLNDPTIYPNPSKFRCGRCAFKAPCLMRSEGSDFDWVLADSFHQRS